MSEQLKSAKQKLDLYGHQHVPDEETLMEYVNRGFMTILEVDALLQEQEDA